MQTSTQTAFLSVGKTIGPRNQPDHRARHLRWFAFAFLTAIFFLATNDFEHASRAMDNYNLTRDELAARSAEGPPQRRVAMAVLGVAALLSLLQGQAARPLRVRGVLGWTFLLFAGWAALSPLWAADPLLTAKRLLPLAIFLLAAVSVAQRFSLRELTQWTFLCTLIFAVVGVLATLFYGTFHPFTAGYRFGGTLDPNSQGINCSLLLLSAAVLADLDRRRRLMAAAGALIAIALLALTGSRTSFAAAIFAFLVYSIAVRSSTVLFAGAAGTSLLACCLLLFAGTDVLPGLKATALLGRDDPGSVDSFNGRSLIWQDLSGYAGQWPVLGFGYGSFWTPARILEISDDEKVGGISSAHSAYLDYLLALGGVGLAGYVTLLLCGVWRAFAEYRFTHNAVYAFCGSLLVFCIVDGILDSNITVAGQPLMFLWMAVTAGLGLTHERS